MPSSLARIPINKQLQILDLVTPGNHGVNTVQAASLLDPSYCITANNAVIDTSGRLAARGGVVTQTTVPVGIDVNLFPLAGNSGPSLLLHFDGTNGQTSTIDSSTNNYTMTNVNAASLSTTTPEFGSACGNFGPNSGSGWYVTAAQAGPGSPLDLHQAVFTVEGWMRTTTTATGRIWSDLTFPTGDTSYIRAYSSAGTVAMQANFPTAETCAGPVSINVSDGNWHHFVCSADPSVGCGVAIDGTWGPLNTYSFDTAPMTSPQCMQIGFDGLTGIQNNAFVGQLDELRITKGTVLYPIGTSFTPPSAPFSSAIANLQGQTSGFLATPWAGLSGVYTILWDTGQQTTGTFVNGSALVTWTPALFSSTAGSGVVLTTPILTSFEYNMGNGTYQEIVAWSGGIANSVINPMANEIQGSVNVTNGQWYFQNFNNKVIGLQAGQKPIVWNGSGNFATVVESAGTAPSGGIGTSAFGRMWVVGTDGQTIQYSGLLDETDWSTTDGNAGLIDMHTIWSNGTDTVTAIAAFNASLVVFGTNHIVFFTDGRGSLLGLDPTQAYVFDTIFNTGCYSQWTVQNIGQGDMLFLGPNGVQSLSNLSTSRAFPQGNVTKYIRDTLLSQVAAETTATVRSTYNTYLGQYYLSLPTTGVIWCIDMRRKYTDQMGDMCAVCTQWLMRVTAMNTTHANITYFARTQGLIGIYSGNTDEGVPFIFNYLSPWLNLGEQVAQHLKMLKRMEAIIFTGGAQEITFLYNTDFNKTAQTVMIQVTASGHNSQYGIGQYGLAQYGGGSTLALIKYPSHARGQYYQVGITSTVSNLFSLQQIQLAVKVGRVA